MRSIKDFLKCLFEPWQYVTIKDTLQGFVLAVSLYVFLYIVSLFNF